MVYHLDRKRSISTQWSPTPGGATPVFQGLWVPCLLVCGPRSGISSTVVLLKKKIHLHFSRARCQIDPLWALETARYGPLPHIVGRPGRILVGFHLFVCYYGLGTILGAHRSCLTALFTVLFIMKAAASLPW